MNLKQVLFAFVVGMTNLYRYYGNEMVQNKPASESFKGFVLYILLFVSYTISCLLDIVSSPDHYYSDTGQSTQRCEIIAQNWLFLFLSSWMISSAEAPGWSVDAPASCFDIRLFSHRLLQLGVSWTPQSSLASFELSSSCCSLSHCRLGTTRQRHR